MRGCLQCAAADARKSLDEHIHEEGFCDHHDHFINTTPESEWETCLAHAVELGLGSREYELIEVK